MESMEAMLLGFVFIGYIILRLMLGHHRTPTMYDRKQYHIYVEAVAQKNYTMVLPAIEKILREKPRSAICWALKAEIHVGLREYHQAILYADKALNIDSSLFETHYNKALSYFYLGYSEEAIVACNKAIWYSREQHADAFYYKGILLLEIDDIEQARYVFEKAIKLGHEKANYAFLKLQNAFIGS